MTYVYNINIINSDTEEVEYTTESRGNNQKEAIKNFRNNESEIRKKFIDKGGFCIGIKRICESAF